MSGLDRVGTAALQRAREAAERTQHALSLVQPDVHDRRHYRLTRALQFALDGRKGKSWAIEADIDEQLQRAGVERRATRNSILVPAWALAQRLDRTGLNTRAAQPYQTTEATAGAELTGTELLGDRFIDALRPRSIVLQLGAQIVTGLSQNAQIPRMDTTSSATWIAPSGSPQQSGAASESEGTFDSTPIVMAPAVMGGFCKVSRLLLLQTGDLGETIISNDLARVLGTGQDAAAIQGSGSGGTPTGVTVIAGTNAVSGATFANATAITAVQDVAAANAIVSRRALGWAATPAVAGLLMARMKVASNSYSPIWEGSLDTGEINGHPALSSTNVPSGTAIFGDWSQVLILGWGENSAIEVEVNPFMNFGTGDVAIRAFMTCNIVIRHPASFSVVSSIT